MKRVSLVRGAGSWLLHTCQGWYQDQRILRLRVRRVSPVGQATLRLLNGYSLLLPASLARSGPLLGGLLGLVHDHHTL